jgi:hypothetical protein
MLDGREFLIDRILVQRRQREDNYPDVHRALGSFMGRRRDGCGN